jgi:hypothetical protein
MGYRPLNTVGKSFVDDGSEVGNEVGRRFTWKSLRCSLKCLSRKAGSRVLLDVARFTPCGRVGDSVLEEPQSGVWTRHTLDGHVICVVPIQCIA